MKKYLILAFAVMFLSGCSVLGQDSRGIDLSGRNIKTIDKNSIAPKQDTESGKSSDTTTPPPKPSSEPPKGQEVKSSSTPDSTQGAKPSLGLAKKVTPKENLGPGQNSNVNHQENGKKGSNPSSDSSNTSALWAELYNLKDRVGVLEDRFDLSSSGDIKEKLAMFKPGSTTELTTEGSQFLKNLIEWSKNGLVENIIVNGNASTKGSDATNLKISEDRAKTVQRILKENGVDSTINAKGETDRYGHNTNAAITWRKK